MNKWKPQVHRGGCVHRRARPQLSDVSWGDRDPSGVWQLDVVHDRHRESDRGRRAPKNARAFEREERGRALLDEKLDRLELAFADVYREIRSQYLLGYVPTNQEVDSRWRTIRLEVLAEDVKVRGREGYRAQER